MLYLGPYGAGFIWLVSLPILAAALLGIRATIVTLILNMILMIVFAILIISYKNLYYLTDYTIGAWVAVSSNFLLINVVTSLPLAVIITFLDKSYFQVKNTKESLQRDVKDLIQAKKDAEKADMLKSIVIANMSHEIRTPMNGIIGFVDLLKHREFKQEQKNKYFEIIESRAHYLLNLLNDIIDLSRLEAGQLKVDFDVIDVHKIFSELYEIYSAQIKKSGKNIILKQERPIDELSLITDSVKFQQIIINLLSNSLKFTEEGKIVFGYKIENHSLVFYVKDTGIGIPNNEKDLIFERFKRVSSVKQKNIEGTGLGLSISKGLIELLGGKIWFESICGKGSVFYFSLPYREVEPIKTLDSYINTESDMTISWKDKVILVVEDDDISTEFLNEVLTPTGVKVFFASNGEDAVELCRNQHIDIILMDIRLPAMNGHAALLEIKKFNKDVVIIAQTAFAMSGDKEKYISMGFDGYISKPIYPRDLIEILSKHFNK